MLESVLAGVLNRFLSAYVDNLNTGQLNVGIWSGDVKLRNLRLKKEALDKFRLPVDVIEGYLGDLTLSIPWSVERIRRRFKQPQLNSIEYPGQISRGSQFESSSRTSISSPYPPIPQRRRRKRTKRELKPQSRRNSRMRKCLRPSLPPE